MFKRKLNIVALVLCFVLILSLLSFAAYEPFKVKLTLFERFVTMTLLPVEGNYRTLKIIWDLRMELAPSEEEDKLAGLEDLPGGGTDAENWEAVSPKEIVFGDVAKGLIVDALTKLDKEEKLTQQHITLYEKFITYAEKPKEGE
ncbi:unnamed protein product [marine sediment metagenome]|uniref:Uncharacterized protein n=1 Tax=marine sediment metagenome TaxID=412755 RepID=X1TYU0_9ZZZZ